MRTERDYSENDVLIILQNFAKDNNLSSGLKIKKWFEQWIKNHYTETTPRNNKGYFGSTWPEL